MNKIIFLIMVAVIGVGGWLVFNPSNNEDVLSSNTHLVTMKQVTKTGFGESLAYVPADTVVFSGGLVPLSEKEFQALMQSFLTPEFKDYLDENIKQLEAIEKAELKNSPPAVKMLFGLYIEYMATIKNSENVFSVLGFSESMDAAIYTIDTVPVLRTKLNNTKAFEQFISRAETARGVNAELKTLQNSQYRSYSFDMPNHNVATDVELLIAIDNGFSVMSIHSRSDTDEQLSRILGIEKPVESLADGKHLQSIMKKHGLLPFSVNYINHSELIKSITQPGGTAFGKMINNFTAAMKKPQVQACEKDTQKCASTVLSNAPEVVDEKPFYLYRTAECRDDLMAMFSDPWPQTVFGYTSVGSGERPSMFSMRMVLESNDKEIMNNLKTLRGHIPIDYRGDQSGVILGSAFGFNVDAMASYSANILNKLNQATYQCQPLVEIQKKNASSKKGLAMAMFTGFAAGWQGFSTSLFDLSFEDNSDAQPARLQVLDALLTISAKDPQTLIMAAKGIVPPLASLQIPADGTAVALPFPHPLLNGMEPKLAIKGNHIVLYVGEQSKAAANSLDQSNVAANGVYDMSIDYGKYMNIFLGFLKNTPSDSPQAKAMEALKGIDMDMTMSIDFKDTGVVWDTEATFN